MGKSCKHCAVFGIHIIAVRLHVKDSNGKELKLDLVSVYSPIGAAPEEERQSYAAQLQKCIDACANDEGYRHGYRQPMQLPETVINTTTHLLQIGIQVRGLNGVPFANKAGQELCTMLGANELCLCLPTTCFRHRSLLRGFIRKARTNINWTIGSSGDRI